MEAPTNPMRFIIEIVFGMSQRAFAIHEMNVAQPTVNGWVKEGYCHYTYQKQIRARALERGLPWNDAWFFEVPADWEKYRNGSQREGHSESQ